MKDEALKLALEALENSVDLVREDAYNAEKLYGNYPSRQGKVGGLKVLADDHEKAITAIKQALAAPVQEPVAILKGIDEYGPIVDWHRHWVTAPIGTKFYTALPAAQPAVPDAMTSADIQEHIEYVAGWNDCRAAMLEMMKSRGNT
jgi:hypothetical protein